MRDSIQFRMHVTCDNVAFEDDIAGELARILHHVADRIERGDDCGSWTSVRDINGNVVGAYTLKSDGALRDGRFDRNHLVRG